nr:lytic transglycosylase domain-containing protein [Sphaerisporangium melleum]
MPARAKGAQAHARSVRAHAKSVPVHARSVRAAAKARSVRAGTVARARTARRIAHHRTARTAALAKKLGSAATTAKGRNKAIAFHLLTQRSWPLNQFRCLDSLWTRESNWNHRAQNPSSGAYGIPQALPGHKMLGVGHDWRVNPATQIRWGLSYIKGRYGSPCGAWGHFRAHNWY